ncbi:MAG TPA: VOC family protein [Fimbriiglobus sp.]|jgi:catechol 2,3-dioxygenase-like lactoylglutathione lyase family enzyme
MSGIRCTHLDHCSVLITDVPAARRFYGEILGLKEIAPPASFDFVAVWYDLGHGYLHLLLKDRPDSQSPRHFCLHVPSAAEARRHLTGKDIPVEETVKIPGCDRFFIYDPDGNRIEILQWERSYDPTKIGRYSA